MSVCPCQDEVRLQRERESQGGARAKHRRQCGETSASCRPRLLGLSRGGAGREEAGMKEGSRGRDAGSGVTMRRRSP